MDRIFTAIAIIMSVMIVANTADKIVTKVAAPVPRDCEMVIQWVPADWHCSDTDKETGKCKQVTMNEPENAKPAAPKKK